MKSRLCLFVPAALLAVLLAAPVGGYAQQQKVGMVAHRGLHKYDGASENSLTALAMAVAHDLAGVEFDMQLTGDDRPVVLHDETLEGMAVGKTTLDELIGMPQAHLAGGESIPTLEEFLDTYVKVRTEQQVRGANTRLFFEIKPPINNEKADLAVALALEAVTGRHLEGEVCFISFSLQICRIVAELMPEAEVAYLGGNLAPDKLHQMGIRGIDYPCEVLEAHPEWVQEAHALDMTVNVWTVNDEHTARKMAELGVDFITTDLPLEISEALKKN